MQIIKYLILSPLFLSLVACGDGTLREKIGIDKSTPDEFQVLSKPPLSVPPEFELKPPQPGVADPVITVPERQAENSLFGKENGRDISVDNNPAKTSSDSILLKKVGANDGNSSIRDQLNKDKEEQKKVEEEKGFFEKLVGSDKKKKEPKIEEDEKK